ncbi:MAG TPA: glycosyltransferase [Thermoleophilaceae bacterium]|nr:glycosyltransferase [Thermoleophilaceae bacterium]
MESPFPPQRTPRVALVHDFLVDLRGADRVFLAMCDIWPEAPVFTAIYDEEGTEGRFAGREVHASFLQRLRPTAQTFRTLLPLYPAAVESLDVSSFDMVVSSSSAWAHAVICDPPTAHVSYCYNPFRYAWNDRERTLATCPDPVSRALLRGLLRRWRQWDWIAAQRVDRYLTISRTAQARIQSYWGRDSKIVHPPVETERFAPGPVGDYYLILSELMRHKGIDVAVEAFNRLKLPLVIAGDGPDARRLRRHAGPTIKFAGRVPDEEAARLLSGCRAFVATAVEEFGIAAVEAQAAGRPVISIGAGGALETVKPGVTGAFFDGSVDDLVRTVAEFDDAAVDPDVCVENARRYDVSHFRRVLPREVERAMRASREGNLERPVIRPARERRRGGLVRRLG